MKTIPRRVLQHSSAWPMLARLGNAAVQAFLAVVIIRQLGVIPFGIWALYSNLTQGLLVFDLGFSDSILREASLAHQRGPDQERNISPLVSLSVLVYLILGTLLVVAGLIHPEGVIKAFGVSPTARHQVYALLQIGGIVTFLSGLAGISQALHIATHQARLFYTVSIVGSVGVLITSVVVIILGVDSLTAFAGCALLMPLVQFLAIFKLPNVRKQFQTDRPLVNLRLSLSYGRRLFVSNLTDLIINNADRFFLAYYTNLKVVAGYEIGVRAANLVRNLVLSTMSIEFRQMTAEPHRQGVDYMERRIAMLTSAGVAFALVILPGLLWVAIGSPLPPFTLISALVASFVTLLLLSTVSRAIFLRVTGHPGLEATVNATNLVVNIGLTLLLAPFFGYWGVVGATVIATLSSVGAFRYVARSTFKLIALPIWRRYFPVLVAASAVVLVQMRSHTGISGIGALGSAVATLMVAFMIFRLPRFLVIPGSL